VVRGKPSELSNSLRRPPPVHPKGLNPLEQNSPSNHKPFILPGATTHYARDRDYHVEHRKLELNVDPEKKKLTGTIQLTLSTLVDNLTRLEFDAIELDIEDVKLSASKPSSFENTGRKLTVFLEKALKSGDRITVSIRYSAEPRRGLYFIGPDKAYPDKPYQAWTQGEDEENRYWFPSYDYPNDRATSELVITVPWKYTAVSNGVLVGVKEEKAKGLKTFHWREDVPHASYLVSIVVGELALIKEKVEDVELQYYVPKGMEEDAKRTFEKTPQMIQFFGEYFGVKYPYPKYAQVVVADFIFGGMENISATTLTDRIIIDKRAGLERLYSAAREADMLIAHELGHQWWGDLLTCRDWSHAWLNEGFATMCEALFKEHELGREEAAYYQMTDEQDYKEEDAERYRRPIVAKTYIEPNELFDRHLYEKGGLVLNTLRYYLGDELFQRGLQHYAKTFREKVVETSDFRRAMEDATGRSLEEFFHQWVYMGGYPEFKVSYDWDDNAKIARLSISQTQIADAETPAVFRTPVDVSFTLSKGVQTKRVQLTQREETFHFSLLEKPKDVEFDPGNWILKTLDFDKPKPMLLHQLQNDKNAIGRGRAAQRLAKYPSEDVVEALKSTTIKDAFWGVQADAAKSLGKIRTTSALKALISALKTKHPKARKAVVSALGEFHDEDAVKALIGVLDEGDPSYYVEAEAAKSLGKTRSSKAFDILKKNLRKESHAEVIRVGVFNGFAELNDPESIPIVTDWTRYGKPHPAREAATKALAKLGEGKTEVVDHLIRLLDDPWFRVRVEACSALGKLLDPKAVEPLQRLIERELDPRVKRIARESIRSIEAGRGASNEFKQLRKDVDELREENRQLKERLESIAKVEEK
jgi:aminopeptidase N